MNFFKWLDKQRALADLRKHRNGFDWMAGELLRGAKTVDELEDLHACYVWKPGPFDEGVKAAIAAYRKLKKNSARPNYLGPLNKLELVIDSHCTSAEVRHAVDRAMSELRESLRGI